MKPLLKNAVPPMIYSFTVKELQDPYFDPSWHFHPEYQLFLVLKSQGTRLIGDSIEHFEEGDLVLLGPNLPHLWRNDHRYYEEKLEGATDGIVIYFTDDCLGKSFFEKQEMADIKNLLEKAQRGVAIKGDTRTIVIEKMQVLLHLHGFERILHLLTILHLISVSADAQPIASLGYINSYKQSETERMSRVHEYVMSNFRQDISLDDLATIANMSPSAFCRYFKRRTNKTLSDFISEIRIGHACKLLIDETMNVTQISYECGFNTLSNFNRQFKAITNENPLSYRKKYIGKNAGV